MLNNWTDYFDLELVETPPHPAIPDHLWQAIAEEAERHCQGPSRQRKLAEIDEILADARARVEMVLGARG